MSPQQLYPVKLHHCWPVNVFKPRLFSESLLPLLSSTGILTVCFVLPRHHQKINSRLVQMEVGIKHEKMTVLRILHSKTKIDVGQQVRWRTQRNSYFSKDRGDISAPVQVYVMICMGTISKFGNSFIFFSLKPYRFNSCNFVVHVVPEETQFEKILKGCLRFHK